MNGLIKSTQIARNISLIGRLYSRRTNEIETFIIYWKINIRIFRFAKPKIVQACCLLLLQFEQNSTFTNHCVLKLLHRIAFDCKFAAILFQASVFRTFQRILNSKEDRHKVRKNERELKKDRLKKKKTC